jgi:hypothetical protein
VHGWQAKQVFRTSLIVSFAALALGGCLEGGGSSDDVADAPTPPPPPTNASPTISGSPPSAINVGDLYSFVPNASDADGDTLTFSVENKPGWASFDTGTGQLSGQPTLADVGVYSNVRISVSDGTATASLSTFTISVDQVGTFSTTLSWTPPTQNEDGTVLEDLAGYKIYWGTTPGVYTNSVSVDAGLTTYVVENLAPGTYEFVATSFNAAGVESVYSNTATKVLQ